MKIVRRVTSLMVAVALSASLALPAVAIAKSGAPAWACAPGDVGSTARGPITDAQGRVREKDTGQAAKALPAKAQGKAPAGFSAEVPVYFHVITDGATGSVTDRQIRVQISVLNKTFGGGEGGDDTGFSFDLAGVTRTDNAEWFAIASFAAETAMKQALKAGGNNALNVYSTSGGGYLG
ncbi:MAG TPA: zinc metalloprotease, partial [Candidatus Limnocylindria bacterium]|nr:zinc metalloprotease [Candidatus Limnocylindria bacterium]